MLDVPAKEHLGGRLAVFVGDATNLRMVERTANATAGAGVPLEYAADRRPRFGADSVPLVGCTYLAFASKARSAASNP
jgi:hypothetical protein